MKDKRETAKEAKARNNKKQKTEEDKCGEKTDDQKEMDMEDAADMVFDRNQSWKTENKQIKSDLLHALEVSGSTYKRVDESGNEIYNRSAMQDIIRKYIKEKNMTGGGLQQKKQTFMTKPTFSCWWDGHFHKRVSGLTFNVIKSFIDQYEFEKEYVL